MINSALRTAFSNQKVSNGVLHEVLPVTRVIVNTHLCRFGLHAMIASNELTPAYFVDTARMLFSLVAELSRDLEITFEIVNLGGGFGIPYRPGEMPLDLDAISHGVRAEYNTWIVARDLPHVTLALECGRFLTGPAGCLVSRVQHVKEVITCLVLIVARHEGQCSH